MNNDDFFNLIYGVRDCCELDLSAAIERLEQDLRLEYETIDKKKFSFDELVASLIDLAKEYKSFRDFSEEMSRSAKYQISVGVEYSIAYMLNAKSFMRTGQEAKAWACLSEAKYWFGALKFANVERKRVALISVLGRNGSLGGKARSENYLGIQLLVSKFIREASPRHGWQSKADVARGFVDKYADHPEVQEIYGDDYEKLERAVRATYLKKGSELEKIYLARQFKDR